MSWAPPGGEPVASGGGGPMAADGEPASAPAYQAEVASSAPDAPPGPVPGGQEAGGSPPRRTRSRWRHLLSPRAFLLIVSILAGVLVAVHLYDAVASVRLPPPVIKGLLPPTVVLGLTAAVAQWLAGTAWIVRRARRRAGAGMAEAAGATTAIPWWRAALALLGVVAFTFAYGVVALGVAGFITLSTSADWQRVKDLDGTVYWMESVFPDGTVYHRELAHGFVSAEGVGWCDQPDCAPPLELAASRQRELDAAATDLSPAPGTPAPVSPAAPSSQPSPGQTGTPRLVPDDAVTVTDESGTLGLTGRGIEVVELGAAGWVPRGVIESTGEPVLLRCASGSCVAGVGTAGGGEVWTSGDGGVTWAEAVLPADIAPEQRFLSSAQPAAEASGTWTVCVGYPSWVSSDAQPRCVSIDLAGGAHS